MLSIEYFVSTIVLVLSATVLVLEKSVMAEPTFDTERLDVYRVFFGYFVSSYRIAKALHGTHR